MNIQYTPKKHNNYSSAIIFKALPKQYSKVDEYLIRGPHPSIKNLLILKQEGVNQIFDFRHLSNFGFKFIEKFLCKLLGIKYTRLPYSNLYGEYPKLETFEQTAAKVKQNGNNGGRTLFHCNSGRHRTAHFAAFYKLTKGESLKKVQAKKNYKQLAKDIIQEQIYNTNYFSRTKIEYKGRNPIKRILIKYNNKIYDCLNNAQRMFLELIKL